MVDTKINLDELPDGVHISTMTVTCNVDTIINVKNISDYIELSTEGILSVLPDDFTKTRTIIPIKPKKKKNKKAKTRNFDNQVTLIVKVMNGRKLNIKVFKNGAIQMTGIKTMEEMMDGLTKVSNELVKKKAILVQKNMCPVPFVEDISKVTVDKIHNYSIRMINSDFAIGFLIDRTKLYNILQENNIKCIYEPCTHAGVNIKYNYTETDTVSIFVFESGSIIITGAKSRDHIVKSHKFILKLLFENYKNIVKIDTDTFLARKDIKKLVRECA
jgi:TATA-box binding protein (TBP) (component of TFIID and TFIIIB)